MQKEITQSATTPMFSTEQQRYLRIGDEDCGCRKVAGRCRWRAGAMSSSRANLEKPAADFSESNAQDLRKEKQVHWSSWKMKRTLSGQLRGTHRQVCLLISLTHRITSILFRKNGFGRSLEAILLTSMRCWLNAPVQLYVQPLMTDQPHIELEVGPAGLSIAQKHQRHFVTDLTLWLIALSLFANMLTVGNPSRASELFGYQVLIAQAASRLLQQHGYNTTRHSVKQPLESRLDAGTK